MKVIKTNQTMEEIVIPVPSFYKKSSQVITSNEFLGVLDENTVIAIYESEFMTQINNRDASLETSKGDIGKAFLEWEKITEDEFMYIHGRVLHSLSLTPVISKEFNESL